MRRLDPRIHALSVEITLFILSMPYSIAGCLDARVKPAHDALKYRLLALYG